MSDTRIVRTRGRWQRDAEGWYFEFDPNFAIPERHEAKFPLAILGPYRTDWHELDVEVLPLPEPPAAQQQPPPLPPWAGLIRRLRELASWGRP